MSSGSLFCTVLLGVFFVALMRKSRKEVVRCFFCGSKADEKLPPLFTPGRFLHIFFGLHLVPNFVPGLNDKNLRILQLATHGRITIGKIDLSISLEEFLEVYFGLQSVEVLGPESIRIRGISSLEIYELKAGDPPEHNFDALCNAVVGRRLASIR